MGVKLKSGDPSKLDQDSTVQEAGITYPSDARLLVKMGGLCAKVYNFLLDQHPEDGLERIDFKKIKVAARSYFFGLKSSIEEKKEKFKSLFYTTFIESCKAIQLSLATRQVEMLPWNVKRAWLQIQHHAKKYFEDVENYIFTGSMIKGKAMSFHLKEVACFNKMKEGKDLQFGRQFQLGRIGGNFMIVTPCTSIRMEDKHSIVPMIELQEQMFGASTLHSFGTDKGYYSNVNQKYLTVEKSIPIVHLQKPEMDLTSLPETELVE